MAARQSGGYAAWLDTYLLETPSSSSGMARDVKAVPRLQALSAEPEKWPSQEFSTFWWNLRKACCYVRSHERVLVDYGARYRKGLPISSATAESAVSQVVSLRMAKKRQMRWWDEGADALGIGESCGSQRRAVAADPWRRDPAATTYGVAVMA